MGEISLYEGLKRGLRKSKEYTDDKTSQLSESIDDIFDSLFSGEINAKGYGWTVGGINLNDGTPNTSIARLRTSDYLKLPVGEVATISADDGCYWVMVFYDENKNFVPTAIKGSLDNHIANTSFEIEYPYCIIVLSDNIQAATIELTKHITFTLNTLIKTIKDEVNELNDIIVSTEYNILKPQYSPNTSNTVISDFIPVDGGGTYGFLIYSGYWELHTFNKSKTLLSKEIITASTYANNQIKTLSGNVSYIRIVVLTTNKDFDMCIAKGNNIPTYKPYTGRSYEFVKSNYMLEYDFSKYGLAYIKDNRLCCNLNPNQNSQTAVYSGVYCDRPIYEMSCTAYFYSNTSNETIAIISTDLYNKNVTDILRKSIHPVFTRNTARIDLFLNNEYKETVYTERYDEPLNAETEYEFAWKIIDAHTLEVKTPTGTRSVSVVEDLTEYTGRNAIIEHYNGNSPQIGTPKFTSWIAKDSNGNVILFDRYTKPDGVLGNTLNGLPYYMYSTNANWRVTN